MLAAARRHQFAIIIVEDISRLWRNRAEFGARSAEFEDLGIHCLTCVVMTRNAMAGASFCRSSRPSPNTRDVKPPIEPGAASKARRSRAAASVDEHTATSRSPSPLPARSRSTRSKRRPCVGSSRCMRTAGVLARSLRSSMPRGSLNRQADAWDDEEAKLIALASSGTLSHDVVAAALKEIERQRTSAAKAARAEQVRQFELRAERYLSALDRLGELGTSDYAEEAQATVRELLGGQGTVDERDGVIGAEFQVAGFLGVAAACGKNLEVGSGGVIPVRSKDRIWISFPSIHRTQNRSRTLS